MAEEVWVYFSAETMSKPNKYDKYFPSDLEHKKWSERDKFQITLSNKYT